MSCFLKAVTLSYAQDVTREHASPEQARLHLVTSEVSEVAPRWADPDRLLSPGDPQPVACLQFLRHLCSLLSLRFTRSKDLSVQRDTSSKQFQASNAECGFQQQHHEQKLVGTVQFVSECCLNRTSSILTWERCWALFPCQCPAAQITLPEPALPSLP